MILLCGLVWKAQFAVEKQLLYIGNKFTNMQQTFLTWGFINMDKIVAEDFVC